VHELRLMLIGDGEAGKTSLFTQHLQLLLDPASTLPLHLNLGKYSCSWENGKFKEANSSQPGFRILARDELMQLMRRLQASPHVILLNLMGHEIDAATMREMAAPIAALSELQALVLVGNDIGDEGCIALSSSLVHLSHLEELYLSDNRIGAEGCIALSSGERHVRP